MSFPCKWSYWFDSWVLDWVLKPIWQIGYLGPFWPVSLFRAWLYSSHCFNCPWVISNWMLYFIIYYFGDLYFIYLDFANLVCRRPLIRIIGDRFPWQVKSAILSTLTSMIKKGGISLKPFLPQLQTTFVKCLQDSTRFVWDINIL